MTMAPEQSSGAAAPVETVAVTIDGFETRVPKGTLIIRAAEHIGVQIPRFCDHPLLDPVGACRQCLVEVEGQRKPVASCTMPVADGMVIKTQLTSPVAEKAQRGNMELLLINHPLDCPICDKGGECPLQNQSMSNGDADSRFRDVKRTFPKPIAISTQVLLDRERCVQCARCTRFAQQIAGDPFIELFERGALEQVGIYEDEPFRSYFSGNTVQVCPVGALTSAQYRFRSRPFDLMSTPSVCEHCASGCAQRTDWRRGKIMRRLAGEDPEVNEEWNCDKGRWSFAYATAFDRFTRPMVRADDGELKPASWTEALERAAQGLAEARDNGGVGVLPGGRLTVEDAYAYAKFARVVLHTNDVDMRARPHSAEELEFLAARVAGVGPADGVTYRDLERAPAVLLAGFEPEEESPIVFLRLRKGARDHGVRVFSLAPLRSDGLRKMSGTLLPTVPGAETDTLRALAEPATGSDGSNGSGDPNAAAGQALRQPGAIILVGERLAEVPGALSAAAALARQTGARLAWIPRRAGERGAIEAGALPGLLPGARLVTDAHARAEVEDEWGGTLPAGPGRDTNAILGAVRDRNLAGLLIGGVDPDDLPDPALARVALGAARFVVSLELRPSVVTEHADVVLPIAPAMEKAGTYLDWEGRSRPFDLTLRGTGAMPDTRVLHTLAEEMDAELGLPTVEVARAEIARLGTGTGARPADPDRPGPGGPGVPGRPAPTAGQAILASWRLLLDAGSLQEEEPYLAGTRKPSVLHLSPATAAEIGVAEGDPVTVRTPRGELTLPLALAELPDRVVWVPTNSPGSAVRRSLGAGTGDLVTLAAGGAA